MVALQSLGEKEQIKYVGQRLLDRGFTTWFRFFFKTVERIDFIYQPIHEELFACLQDIYDLKTIRQIINICPGAGKTTACKYFVAYCLARNPKCKFIYTSFNQDLLRRTNRELINILDNDLYKAMYNLGNITTNEVVEKPIDGFWSEYFNKSKDGKEITYTTKTVETGAGGIVFFNSIGSAITGMSAGVLNMDGMTGGVIIDDANKIQDSENQLLLEKVQGFYVSTLSTRMRNSNAFVLNIQQRICEDDLSDYLETRYKFNVLKCPLVVDGVCRLPETIKEARLEEIMLDSNLFEAQYQQRPVKNLYNKPFNDVKIEDKQDSIDKGGWVGWFDPAGSGKDYSSICLVKRYGAFLRIYGWMWRKDWRFCLDNIEELDEMFDIKKLVIETNMTGDIIINQFQELGANVNGYRTNMNKIEKILGCSIYAQNMVLYHSEYEAQANKDFIYNVKDWTKYSKHDDGIDSISSYLWYSGLVYK